MPGRCHAWKLLAQPLIILHKEFANLRASESRSKLIMHYYQKKSGILIPHGDKFATAPVLHSHCTETKKNIQRNSLLSFITTPAKGQKQTAALSNRSWHWPQTLSHKLDTSSGTTQVTIHLMINIKCIDIQLLSNNSIKQTYRTKSETWSTYF